MGDRGGPRSVLVVDDHASFRSAARALLQGDGFEVVGESEDAASALAAVARLRPAIVLLDIGLPDGDGFEVAELLARRADPPVVILISSREVAWYQGRLAESPARGFIAKGELSVDAIEALMDGA
ncbi:MAG: response regulator transcription factor [Gaiellaceae bacterium]